MSIMADLKINLPKTWGANPNVKLPHSNSANLPRLPDKQQAPAVKQEQEPGSSDYDQYMALQANGSYLIKYNLRGVWREYHAQDYKRACEFVAAYIAQHGAKNLTRFIEDSAPEVAPIPKQSKVSAQPVPVAMKPPNTKAPASGSPTPMDNGSVLPGVVLSPSTPMATSVSTDNVNNSTTAQSVAKNPPPLPITPDMKAARYAAGTKLLEAITRLLEKLELE